MQAPRIELRKREICSASQLVNGGAISHGAWLAHCFGVNLARPERTLIERPGRDSKVDQERQASFSIIWFGRPRAFKRVSGQLALGAGYRSYHKASNDPLLGDVEVHVITLFHGRSIVEWQIADRVNLGIAFDWNIAVFTSASYVDPSAYISATDSEPPELGTGNEMTNIYSVGPRVSVDLF